MGSQRLRISAVAVEASSRSWRPGSRFASSYIRCQLPVGSPTRHARLGLPVWDDLIVVVYGLKGSLEEDENIERTFEINSVPNFRLSADCGKVTSLERVCTIAMNFLALQLKRSKKKKKENSLFMIVFVAWNVMLQEKTIRLLDIVHVREFL